MLCNDSPRVIHPFRAARIGLKAPPSEDAPLRQVGTIPLMIDAQYFGDYLESIGIGHRFMTSGGSTAVWVLNEDQIGAAKIELDQFLVEPYDPKYRLAKTAAEAARRENERIEREYARNVRHAGAAWGPPDFKRKPLTSVLVGLCVALFIVGHAWPAAGIWMNRTLLFFPMGPIVPTHDIGGGLKGILSGQFWRLWTPALLHANLLHLAFNMWALNSLGTLLEIRKGTLFLGAVILLSAIVSNIGQYLYMLNFQNHLSQFLGISGVVYALFGYVWIKGRLDIEAGMYLHPNSVRIMLFWLVLGFVGIFPIANGAHLTGLIVGVLLGFSRF